MGRPQHADAERTKRLVLESAIRLFGAHGYKASGTRAIAADAGVTFATLHYYFVDKQGLFEACLDAGYAQLADLRGALTTTLAATEGSVRDKLVALATEAFQYARDNAEVCRFLLRATLYEEAARDRTERSQEQYLSVASTVLAPLVERPAAELRVPLQGLMFLLTRFAVMSERERRVLAGADPVSLRAAQDDALAGYVADVALSTLFSRNP